MSPTRAHALRRLARSATAIWLVQVNPRTVDLARGRTGLPDSWCVKRHVTEIRPGDRIVLWLSGAGAGVHALGEVTADAQPAAPPAVPGAVVEMRVRHTVDLFDRPVTRAVLQQDPRFADASIIRQPFAANPHRLSPPAFEAILERIAGAAPPAPDAGWGGS